MDAYKHCFYDKLSKSIYLRTVADTHYKKIPYEKDYWVKDPSGQSNITDIYGVPMIRKTNYSKKTIDKYKRGNIPVAESDLKEDVKFLHTLYDKENLVVDMSKWNICLFDIECESGGLDENKTKIRLKKDNHEVEDTITNLKTLYRKS